VVTHIVPLAETDQHGRKGRYLAHSLVFTPEAFAHLEAAPFWVFQHFSFITTVEEALAHGDFQTGDMPAATLQVAVKQEQPTDIARRWSTQELQKLALLDVHFISSLPVILQSACKAWVERTPVQIVAAED
jgi:hypothetical protein